MQVAGSTPSSTAGDADKFLGIQLGNPIAEFVSVGEETYATAGVERSKGKTKVIRTGFRPNRSNGGPAAKAALIEQEP
jgi:hypothetical protein